jgi:hypothetical protein
MGRYGGTGGPKDREVFGRMRKRERRERIRRRKIQTQSFFSFNSNTGSKFKHRCYFKQKFKYGCGTDH